MSGEPKAPEEPAPYTLPIGRWGTGSGRRALSGAAPGTSIADEGATSLSLPESVRYEPGGLLGAGGMGEVRAVFDRRLGRMVARKTPRDADAAVRLAAEARLTARLVHPGIVTVLDGGRDEEGRPCYTMPILHGRSLAEVARGGGTPTRLRLVRHVLEAARAVGFAHSEGVLHRDLKPEHVFVGLFGETCVVDWGLAGQAGEAAPGVGTPGYMAPEQRAGEPLSPATDVWSLGATLHELLTGAVPDDPPRPCRQRTPDLPPDLAAIVDRALRTSPYERYPDASALAEDLEAWFEGRRVMAHRYSAWELLQRVWAAWRAPIVVVGVAVAAAVGAVTVATLRTMEERDRAVDAEARAHTALDEAERSLAQAQVARALDAMARDDRAEAEVLASSALAWGPSPDAVGVLTRFDGEARPVLQRRYDPGPCHRIDVSGDGVRVACFRHDGSLEVLEPGAPVVHIFRKTGTFERAAFSGDHRYLFAQQQQEMLSVVDLEAPERSLEVRTTREAWPRASRHLTRGVVIARGRDAWVDAIKGTFEPGSGCLDQGWGGTQIMELLADGRGIVGCQNGLVRMGSGGAWETLYQLEPIHGPPISSGTDGELLVIAQARGVLTVLRIATGELVRSWSGGEATFMEVAVAGDRVVGGADDGGVMVWEAQSGELVARLPSVRAHVRWLDAGRTLRVVGTVVEDWLLPPRSPWPHVHVTAEGVAAVAVAPDGRFIASAHGDGHVRVARVDQEGFLYDIALHDSVTKDVAFSPDGAHIAVICAGRPQVVVLDAATGAVVRTLDSLNARSLVWLREGILITPYAGGLQWWADPLRGGDPVSIGALARAHDLQPWPDRRGAALLDAKAVLWEIVGTELPSVRRVSESAETGSIMSDGVQQVSLRGDVLVHRDPHGVERSVRADGGMPLWVTADPGFRRAAIGHQDGTVRVWSLPDLALRAVLRGHTSRTLALAFSADGRFLVTGSWDGDVRVWSMRPLELPADTLVEEAVGAWGRTAHDLLGLRGEL